MAIVAGNDIVDQIFTVLLSSSMFVGGFSGFLLDNTVPGILSFITHFKGLTTK